MQPINQNSSAEAFYRVSTIIWFALLVSQFLFFLVVYFTHPELFSVDFSKPFLDENAPFVIALAVVAISTVGLSFVLKAKLFAQAVAEQKLPLLQTGLIIALALCESASLFGVVLAFAFHYRYFFLWLAFGILATLLHFPRRQKFIDAGYKRPS